MFGCAEFGCVYFAQDTILVQVTSGFYSNSTTHTFPVWSLIFTNH